MEAALGWEKENKENYKKLKEKLTDEMAEMFIYFRKDGWTGAKQNYKK